VSNFFPSITGVAQSFVSSTIAPLGRPPQATTGSEERHNCAAHVALFERIHPGIFVRVALAICFSREVDWYPDCLPIRWDVHLRADVLGEKLASQLGKATMAPAGHPVRCPAAADTSETESVGVKHVGEGLGGVALDVAYSLSAASETGKAKEQNQLESHPRS